MVAPPCPARRGLAHVPALTPSVPGRHEEGGRGNCFSNVSVLCFDKAKSKKKKKVSCVASWMFKT